MPQTFLAESEEHFQAVEELFWEYLEWANSKLERYYSFTVEIQSMRLKL